MEFCFALRFAFSSDFSTKIQQLQQHTRAVSSWQRRWRRRWRRRLAAHSPAFQSSLPHPPSHPLSLPPPTPHSIPHLFLPQPFPSPALPFQPFIRLPSFRPLCGVRQCVCVCEHSGAVWVRIFLATDCLAWLCRRRRRRLLRLFGLPLYGDCDCVATSVQRRSQ